MSSIRACWVLLFVAGAQSQTSIAEIQFYKFDSTCTRPDSTGYFTSTSTLTTGCTNLGWNNAGTGAWDANVMSLRAATSDGGTVQFFSDNDCATLAFTATAGTCTVTNSLATTGASGSVYVESVATSPPEVGLFTYSVGANTGVTADDCQNVITAATPTSYPANFPYYKANVCYQDTASTSVKLIGCYLNTETTSWIQPFTDTSCTATSNPACNYQGAPLECFSAVAVTNPTCTLGTNEASRQECKVNGASRAQFAGLFGMALVIALIGSLW